jgi:hypothetical protein
MYQSYLRHILRKALESTKWTRSTKDEDNFRQVLCASLYEIISPNNVEIPSTRAAHGDIRIFGRRIEIMYANSEKVECLDKVLEDFDLLLESKIEFALVALRLDVAQTDSYLHNCIRVPMLKANGGAQDFAAHHFNGSTYAGVGIFLPGTFPQAPKPLTLRVGSGKNSTTYLNFDASSSIDRSAVVETGDSLIHVDVIGSREDVFIAFLFKRMDGFELIDHQASQRLIQIPYAPTPIILARCRNVGVRTKNRKYAEVEGVEMPVRPNIETGITVYAT